MNSKRIDFDTLMLFKTLSKFGIIKLYDLAILDSMKRHYGFEHNDKDIVFYIGWLEYTIKRDKRAGLSPA